MANQSFVVIRLVPESPVDGTAIGSYLSDLSLRLVNANSGFELSTENVQLTETLGVSWKRAAMEQSAHDSLRSRNGACIADKLSGCGSVAGPHRRPRRARRRVLLAGPVLALAFLVGAPQASTAASLLAGSGPAAGTVLVADEASNAVTEYAPGANGSVAPVATISGSNTRLARPRSVVRDSHGDLFVSSRSAVTEYPPGASGNTAPIARISGSETLLRLPDAMAINSSGDLFVLDDFFSVVAEFPPGSNGNVRPHFLTFNQLGIAPSGGLALNSTGDLFVAADYNEIVEFAPGATGRAMPIATIGGGHTGLDDPTGMAFDSSGDLFVANATGGNGGYSVTEYAPRAHGNATPIATITGTNTGLAIPVGLAFNASGDLFAANDGGNTVTEYAPGANGNVAPIATISGPDTGLQQPDYLTVIQPAVPLRIRRFVAALNPFAILYVHGCAEATVPGAGQPGPWMAIQYAARPAGPWHGLGRVSMTSSDGGCHPGAFFAGSLPVRLPSAYYRASFPGNADFRPAVSKAVHRWKYLTRIVSLTVRPRSVSAGGDITVKGRLEQQHGRTWRGYRERQVLIVLRPRGSNRWYRIHKVNSNARGWFSKTFKDPVTADWSAIYKGDNTHFACPGAIRHVTVTGALAATWPSAWPWHYTWRRPGFPAPTETTTIARNSPGQRL